jgi:transmembrane sensor
MAEIGFESEKVSRFFNEESSEMDSSYVADLFCNNGIEEELKNHLLNQFNELLPEDEADNKNLDHILYRIHYNINTGLSVQKAWSFENIIKWSLRIAGIVMLPIVIFIGIQTYKDINLKKESWVEINAPAWSRIQFSLPDGTSGWLNSNSSLKYAGNFNSDRQVTLTGEGYFDVFKDKKRPFVVNTNDIIVKALGTRFNIASYENENKAEVVLEEGKLVISDRKFYNTITLIPNDLVVYDRTLNDFSSEVVLPQKYLSWTEGKLVFRNDPLDVIARKLERWYNVDVELVGVPDQELRLRATFIDEGLEEVLGLLKRSLMVDFKIENREIMHDETYTKKKVILTLKTR